MKWIFFLLFAACSSVQLPSIPTPEAVGAKPGPIAGRYYLQLSGDVDVNRNVDIFNIDMEDNAKVVIPALKKKGKKVICYFSAGTYENWRSDAGTFPKSVLGKALPDWPGEKWLDIRSDALKPIMKKRMDKAQALGCDGIDPDNVDGYSNKSGFPLTADDQVKYLKWLASEAHSRGMGIGLKNSLDLISKYKLATVFDWAMNEQCYQYDECDKLKPFIANKKPVYIAEYEYDSTKYCTRANADGFMLAVYNLDLAGKTFKPCY